MFVATLMYKAKGTRQRQTTRADVKKGKCVKFIDEKNIFAILYVFFLFFYFLIFLSLYIVCLYILIPFHKMKCRSDEMNVLILIENRNKFITDYSVNFKCIFS